MVQKYMSEMNCSNQVSKSSITLQNKADVLIHYPKMVQILRYRFFTFISHIKITLFSSIFIDKSLLLEKNLSYLIATWRDYLKCIQATNKTHQYTTRLTNMADCQQLITKVNLKRYYKPWERMSKLENIFGK